MAVKKNQTETQAKSPAESINNVTITVPPSRAVLVLGVDTHGRLYSHLHGDVGLVEFGGLIAYGEHILQRGYEQSVQVNPNAPRG